MKPLLLMFAAAAAALAQDPPAPPADTPPGGGGPPGGAGRQTQPVIRPYEKVITSEAKTDDGIFKVHRIKDRLYYEIPKDELGKEFLWVAQIAKTTLGVGYGGQAMGNRVVKWERRGDRVLLRTVVYEVIADRSQPISRAVEASNNSTILAAFNIEAIGKNDAPVIEVTRIFTSEVPELSARARLRARGFDASRSFLERAVSFPTNIEVEATHTYTAPIEAPTFGGPRPETPPGNPFFGAGMRPGSASVVMHYSMVKLPEKPMMPRLFDERVGYFSQRQIDYGKDEHKAVQTTYIRRWRLEKKDPNAALSEPVKPIVYYIDAATPKKWVPYMKRGVEKWQAAFEEAGFKNAIIAKEAPTPEQDPEWSPEDARYSVIRWLPSTIENASGPHVADPRTGEILESDIQFYHNVMNLNKNWYFVQAGPLDARAKKLPLPDDLMGELIEYVCAHEVGHTLGFQHNMKASSLYPLDKIRNAEWLKTMGHTPTLMDYSRFNYVVQPEDQVDPKLLIPQIGPYDKWATAWGYKLIPGAKSPEDEKKTLNEWAREQDSKPWLRFNTAGTRGADYGEQTEAVGDADAVEATRLGLKNLERVSAMLLEAAIRPGEDWDELEEVYGRMLGQWAVELGHVANVVGSFDSQQKHGGQEGVRFTITPKVRQTAAVKFLNDNAFATPKLAIRPEILRRIEPDGVLNRLRTAQSRVLNALLANTRLSRMVEQEAIDGEKAYKPAELLADVRKGIFSELDAPAPKVDVYRRNTQRVWLQAMSDKIAGRSPVSDEVRPLARGEMRALSAQIAAVLPRTTDRATRYHLEDLRDQIAKALDPKFVPPAPTGSPSPFGAPGMDEEEHHGCWPDTYIGRE
ncbi:MAG: zinc-dependent metalloprotease [Bryobacteraceae bacterium]|nr:zinc-dependent metalloprotease [Bryobacteraceae bacterium]